ncbi:MAG: type II toxin-antitoxin system RelB/DinJ family antitoxin [Paludibacterium sp.]|uniref:type II toxin-antitoxin system RelB/DinJ family antitoxin n=1 Tax=Paludibacterium sp. TaxID=1917523 RepID=UPI0025F7C116|nr:type II toxin-antitoxin system RelB/DinJ family antitoxin [Paludibacterium sp.]MBV8049338.1 type II toxin-antitoxin system RelB/DinJ family antitoxin [Paludibacterium sp.]MBV8647966.1 type II toxin-antitoxin system RelB/DinJ family antitoxin [Paludibacterium sp.]
MDSTIRARIDERIKESAAEALHEMGLSISDAIRMLMIRIAEDRCLPFEVRANPVTMAAIKELDDGKGQRYSAFSDLLEAVQDDAETQGTRSVEPVLPRSKARTKGAL